MQLAARTSLNALRVFVVAAQSGSLKRAAQQLNVTPGAVSHQVRQLESSLGVQLFTRRNNAIDLTEAGETLLAQATPGLEIIETALTRITRDAQELTLCVSMTLATRWLIPRLEAFKHRNPGIHLRLETVTGTGAPPGAAADLTIAYHRHDDLPDGADILFEDRCRPYLSPGLLAGWGGPLPVLKCAEGNWDWVEWSRVTTPPYDLNIAGEFDLDDTALRAAVAGMGAVLSPRFMIEEDLTSGRLVPLPGSQEALLGCYALYPGSRPTGLSERFTRWLKAQAT